MIDQTQEQLEDLYNIKAGIPASELLIEHHDLKSLLGDDHPFIYSEEVVLACSSSGELEVGIFFNDDILQNLSNLNQHQEMTLMEGVSHYLLFVHKHQNNLVVNNLELEMQAQIDKFLLFVLDQEKRYSVSQVLEMIDQKPNLSSLDQDLKDMYQESNDLALGFCHRLNEDFLRKNKFSEFYDKIRQFYRQDTQEKLRQVSLV